MAEFKIEKIKSKKYTLIQGNCLDYLDKIPDNSIDLMLTDPPYNIAQYSTGNINLPGRSALNNDLGEWDLTTIEPSDFIKDFKRILKPDGNIFIFTSYNLIGKWHEVFDKEFDTFQFFIWHKTNPAPKIYKNGFLNSCEMIICMWNKGHKWNFGKQNEMHNFFESPICMRVWRPRSGIYYRTGDRRIYQMVRGQIRPEDRGDPAASHPPDHPQGGSRGAGHL